MADRFPLILNTNANQIQEIASGDTLDLTGNNVSNAGVITATSFSGPVVAGAGVSNITAGIGTYTDLRVGGNTTFSEDLVVTGNARVTGILTVGTSSIILNDGTDTIKVGSQNLHSAGFEVNQINASGIITASTFIGALTGNVTGNVTGNTSGTAGGLAGTPDISVKDLDVDGHTNLDNVSVAGVTTFTGNIDANGELDVDGPTHLDYVSISGVTTHSDTVHIIDDKVLMFGSGGDSTIEYDENGTDQLTIAGAVTRFTNTTQSTSKDTGSVIFEGGIGVEKDLSVGGNVSIGGTLTYEDVTNIDSVGIVTAREGIFVPDNKVIHLGNVSGTGDLQIYHDTSHSYVKDVGVGDLVLQTQGGHVRIKYGGDTMALFQPSNKAELYFANSPKLATTNTGVTITGNIAVSGTVDGVDIAALNTTVGNISTDLVNDSSPQLGGDLDVNSNKIKGGHTIYEIVANTRHKFDCNGSTIMNINAGGVDFSAGHNTHSDNVENRHGTHNDIRIYHSGSHSYIKNTTDYTLWIQNNDSQAVNISNNSGANVSASFNIGGAAQLFHANTKRFETESGGAKVFGQLTVDGQIIAYSANNNTLGLTGHRWANIFSQQGNFNNTVTIGASSSSDALIIQNSSNLKFCDGNGATTGTVSFDARTYDTNKARLHKWTSPALGGGSYGNYSEAWYDGGAYRHITSKNAGFEFDHHLFPSADNSKDLGTSSNRWRNVYTNDLNLSNEGSTNNVDGTWGNYTIQEGESDLYLINNRNGKKYKFNLTEVS